MKQPAVKTEPLVSHKKKGFTQCHSSFKISPPLPQFMQGGCFWWDTPLMLSENKGYRITNPKFSKTVISVSHNGAIQTTLLLDKLIWATGCQPRRFPKSPHSGQYTREGTLTHHLKKTLQRTNVKPSKKQKLNDKWCCVKPKDRGLHSLQTGKARGTDYATVMVVV